LRERASPCSRLPLTEAPDPKGRAEGAPNVPDRGGFRKGGPAPPLAPTRDGARFRLKQLAGQGPG